jgi:hypothetical protein
MKHDTRAWQQSLQSLAGNWQSLAGNRHILAGVSSARWKRVVHMLANHATASSTLLIIQHHHTSYSAVQQKG